VTYTNPVPPLFRTTDPATSKAAAKQADVTGRAKAVADVMRDGVPRTDEQIAAAMAERGLTYSHTSACHGRLSLCRDGLLVQAGTATTAHGRQSIVWQWREATE